MCLCPAHYHSVSRVEPSVSIQTRHSPTKSLLLFFTDHAITSHFNSRLFGESIDAGNCDHFDCKSNTVILTDDHSWESQYQSTTISTQSPQVPTFLPVRSQPQPQPDSTITQTQHSRYIHCTAFPGHRTSVHVQHYIFILGTKVHAY